MARERAGFAETLAALRALEGQRVQVSVAFVPPEGHLADEFVLGQPMWGIAQFAGRVESVRRSSRDQERWYVDLDAPLATSFTVDESGFDWGVVEAEEVVIQQRGVVLHVSVDEDSRVLDPPASGV